MGYEMEKMTVGVIWEIIKFGWINFRNKAGLYIFWGLGFFFTFFIIPFRLIKGFFNAPTFLMPFMLQIKNICVYGYWIKALIWLVIGILTYFYWM